MVLTIIVGIFRKRVSKFIKKIESIKQLNLLNQYTTITGFSTFISSSLLIPILVYKSFHFESFDFWKLIYTCLFIICVVICLYIIDYYVEYNARRSISYSWLMKISLVTEFFFSIFYEFYQNGSNLFTWSTFTLFLSIILSQHILLDNIQRKKEPVLPINSNIDQISFFEKYIKQINQIIKEIWANPVSRKIFLFLLVNFAFMFVEFIYGFWTNSLGLMTDAFHMLFDCTALAIGLFAEVISKWPANEIFTYGFGRVEVIAGFLNAIFLCLIAFSIFIHSIVRVWAPPEILTDKLLLISVIGLGVNLIGIFAFHDFDVLKFFGFKKKSVENHESHHHGHKNHDCNHEHSDNLTGIFLHILADALGSVSVIISSILISLFNWNIVDPIASLLISILIFASVIPLLKSSILVLMQHTPSSLEHKLPKIFKKIQNLQGILTLGSIYFWKNASDDIIGSLHIRVSKSSNRQYLTYKILDLFDHYGIKNITIQIERE